MDLSKITDVLTDYPYATAAAVVVGLYLFSRGDSTTPTGSDQSATLASMQIASETNVALATVQAQRDSVALQATRDIAIANIGRAVSDRQTGVMLAASAMDSTRLTAESQTNAALSAFQSALGFTAAKKELENQRAQLDTTQVLGYADITSNRDINMASITSARDLGISQINADIDITKFLAPFNERMHLQEQETVRNLAWRQKQIAKYGAKMGFLGDLVSSLSGIASQSISTFGGK